MSPRRASRGAAWAVFALVMVLFAAIVVLALLNDDRGAAAAGVVFALAMLAFPVVGLLICSRLPGNAIGWLLLAIGVAWMVGLPVVFYAAYGAVDGHHAGSLPGSAAAAALGQALWLPAVSLMGTFLALLFPDGRLPGPRWRWVLRLSAFAMVVGTVAIPLSPGPLTDAGYPETANPLGVEVARMLKPALIATITLLPLTIAASAVGLVLRYRRAHGVERLQLKWLVTAVALVAAYYVITFPLNVLFDDKSDPLFPDLREYVGQLTFCLIPIAIGFAVLRHRLYGIDVIIRRTVVYTGLIATLGALYFGGVALVGAALGSLTGRYDVVAVTVSTLAVVAAFHPLRRRIQRAIDHRFYRGKYDAEAAVEGLSRTLRQQVDLGAVEDELLGVVARTVQPSHAGLWLRSREEAR